MKKTNLILLVFAILSIMLTASQCNRTPQGDIINDFPTPMPEIDENPTEEVIIDPTTVPTVETLDWLEDVTMDEFVEAVDEGMETLDEEEKQKILDALVDLPADELNAAIKKVMDNLTDDQKEEFLAWLKEHYLIYQNATIDKWALPENFSVPGSMEWPTGIPQPDQGSVYIVSQGGDVIRIVLVNMTKNTYADWEAKFTDDWANFHGLMEYTGADKEKYTEYVGNNTIYNFGPDTQTTLELFLAEDRLGGIGVLQGRLFGDLHMSKWLELAYNQNMATLTFNGDFSGWE